MYKHSITTVSLPGSLETKVKAIAHAGYDGFELFENDLTISNIRPQDLAQMVADLNLEIAALQPFRDYEALPYHLHLKSLDRAEYKFDLMEKLNIKRLFVCSNCSPFAIDNPILAAEQLYILAERALKRGISVAYEALSWGRYVNLYHQSIEIVKLANHPNLGNLLDSYHIGIKHESLDALYALPKEKIAFIQVADSHYFDMSAIYVGRHLRCFPGQGTFPVTEFMNAVQATGYEGYISHEIFSDDFRGGNSDQVARDGKKSLIWLENNMNFPPKPPVRFKIKGIEFIEFATDFMYQQNLIELLSCLGFQETFVHKSRAVSIFQNGKINIVLNRQKTKVNDKSDNSVCAVGLITENFGVVKNWAQELKYKWIDSQAKPDELQIPAVHGLGDIIYYFVDEESLKKPFYEVEFIPTNKTVNYNGVTHIDHIGHTVKADFFQSETLFYRAMLGLEIEENVELFDPNGVVQSRVLKNENLRISLSATKDRQTGSSYFIDTLGGAGIQQIALATNDIFETAKSISKQEYVLPIPSNYYEDLKSKQLISNEEVEKIKAHNILFDTNDDGHFYHFYMKELNGLFFEVVQRIGQYDRYGEINAQLRLAAQSRDRA